MRFPLLVLLLVAASLPALAQAGDAPADSVRVGAWGAIEAPHDSNTVRLEAPGYPAWEKGLLVPYYLVGLPFRILNAAGHETIEALDEYGVFSMPPVEEAGLALPYGFLLLPQGGYSSLQGFEMGVNIRHPGKPGKGDRAYLVMSTSTRHADHVGAGLGLYQGERWGLALGGGGEGIPLARYFGRGMEARKEDESYYNRVARWAGFDLTRDVGHASVVRFQTYFSLLKAQPSGYEQHQALEVIHGDDLPLGFPGESSGLTWKLDLIHDSADVDGRPTRGTFKRLSMGYFQNTDSSDLQYLQYTFDMQKFFPLWHTKRALGLRVYGTRILSQGDAQIPLTRLVTTYRPYGVRGLESNRFYGLGNLGFSAEYRWPVWVVKGREETGLDAYIFADSGQIYDSTREIGVGNFQNAVGIGLRLLGGEDDFKARVELGFGEEDTQFSLTFSQSFQYLGRGLMYGKDPTRRP